MLAFTACKDNKTDQPKVDQTITETPDEKPAPDVSNAIDSTKIDIEKPISEETKTPSSEK
jgi:hypothetical protein